MQDAPTSMTLVSPCRLPGQHLNALRRDARSVCGPARKGRRAAATFGARGVEAGRCASAFPAKADVRNWRKWAAAEPAQHAYA